MSQSWEAFSTKTVQILVPLTSSPSLRSAIGLIPTTAYEVGVVVADEETEAQRGSDSAHSAMSYCTATAVALPPA